MFNNHVRTEYVNPQKYNLPTEKIQIRKMVLDKKIGRFIIKTEDIILTKTSINQEVI